MTDIRYSELVFLQKLAEKSPDFQHFTANSRQLKIVGLDPIPYIEMAVTLLEEWYICFSEPEKQLIVARLCGEVLPDQDPPHILGRFWKNPRQGIQDLLNQGTVYQLRITYKGLRRIEELREQLQRDRILEHFGVLLDLRYVHTDLQSALQRSTDLPVSVLYADLDGFKQINDNFGHPAGDVVLRRYLEIVHHSLGSFGTAYRGRGDEVVAIIIGQWHEKAVKFAEQIRESVKAMDCTYNDKPLPSVTASIGVATTPPENRSVEIESIAEARNRRAKSAGKNQVISVA